MNKSLGHIDPKTTRSRGPAGWYSAHPNGVMKRTGGNPGWLPFLMNYWGEDVEAKTETGHQKVAHSTQELIFMSLCMIAGRWAAARHS